MNVYELTKEQLFALKINYLDKLASEGVFAEVLDTDHGKPTKSDFDRADSIVPDDVIYREYEGYDFDDEYFEL